MVKIECSNCNSWIQLLFNSRQSTIICPQCSALTRVNDVYVSGGPFLLYRDVLVKNMHKYRRLVSEAEKDILALQKKASASRAYEISARSLSRFVSDLKEMMDGCRDTVRYRLYGVKTQYVIDKKKYNGNILNISVSGICLEAGKGASVNRLWNDASVLFKGKKTGPFAVAGKVVWLCKDGRMGINFANVYDTAASLIREYIMEKTENRNSGKEGEGPGTSSSG